jgi:integrase
MARPISKHHRVSFCGYFDGIDIGRLAPIVRPRAAKVLAWSEATVAMPAAYVDRLTSVLYRKHARSDPIDAREDCNKTQTPNPAPDGAHVIPSAHSNSEIKALSARGVLRGPYFQRVYRIIETTRHADRNRLAFVLSVYGGMRVGEIAALKIKDVAALLD